MWAGGLGLSVMLCFNASYVLILSPQPLMLLHLGRTWGKSLDTREKLLYCSGYKGVFAILVHTLVLEKGVRAMCSLG